MPREAPVTSAVLPAKLIMSVAFQSCVVAAAMAKLSCDWNEHRRRLWPVRIEEREHAYVELRTIGAK
jgi:hypothetical protein